MARVLLTGYSGFIGQALSKYLHNADMQVTPVIRSADTRVSNACIVSDIGPRTDWWNALEANDYVIHLAATVHLVKPGNGDLLSAYRSVNTEGTLHLARCAAQAGVRRFIYLSSVKVNGESTAGVPFTENDAPNPQEPYARSKYEAEKGLRAIAADTGMETVIIRPPLVYGPGVKANFLRLLRIVDSNIVLPFFRVRNKRSLIGVENLCDFIYRSIEHPAAAGEIFLLSDGDDISTPRLIARLRHYMNRPPRMVAVSPKLLKFIAGVFKKKELADRLLASLQVDASKARELLDWQPPLTLDEGLRRTVDWYLEKR